jgi:nucleotide-binding universal stress UspA family protein
MFKHLMLPTDGSPHSNDAVRSGIELAAALKSAVTLMTVFAPWKLFSLDPLVSGATTEDQYLRDTQEIADARLKPWADLASSRGVVAVCVRIFEEHPWKAIVDEAANLGCDLIVMASHGRRGVVAGIIGSESLKVLTHARIPVEIHRAPPDAKV